MRIRRFHQEPLRRTDIRTEFQPHFPRTNRILSRYLCLPVDIRDDLLWRRSSDLAQSTCRYVQLIVPNNQLRRTTFDRFASRNLSYLCLRRGSRYLHGVLQAMKIINLCYGLFGFVWANSTLLPRRAVSRLRAISGCQALLS